MRLPVLCTFLALMLLITGCSSGPKPIAVTLTSPTGAQALDVGQTFNITATVSNDKLTKGATFALSGVGTLTNQTSTGATYTATATGNATITIASASDPTKSQTITVVVTAAPTITTAASLSAATEGTAYSAAIAATGGAGAMTYSVTVGSLPAGLTLNSSTGAITGTATGPNGTVNFTVQVKDSSTVSPQTNSKAFSVTINLPPPPSIASASFAAGVEGTAYTQTIAETGGLAPFTYSIIVGALPAGLSVNTSTGAITGTPTGPNATASFTMKVVDSSNPAQSATQTFSIAINLPPAPAITTSSLSAGVEGTAYNQTVAATGYGKLAYSVSLGTLPAGLSLNSSTGAITGTPTGPNGTASFTIQVTDGSNPAQSTTKPLSILVNLPPAPAISTTTLPGGVEFTAYNQTVAATGYGPLVYSISLGTLPAGLGINSSTGAITGSPTGPNGTASFTVQVTDHSNPAQSATQALTIAVSLPQAPAITTTSLPNATVGGSYNQSLSFTGGHPPFTWSISAGSLPSGFSINSSTGAITATSVGSTTGTSTFTVMMVDSSNPSQSATQSLSISVVTGPLLVAPATLPTGAVSDVYPSTNLGASGGAPPYTWSITTAPATFPAGLSLSSAGQITGTPTASGTYNFTAQVKDSINTTATGNFTITVNAMLAVTTSSLPAGTQGTSYTSTNLNASGGVTPYNWSITSGSLPTGLNLNGNNISGIPQVSGTFPVTFTVTDASSGTASSTGLSIVLAAAPALTITTTSGSLSTGTVNAAYPTTNLNASGGFQPYTWSITSAAGTFPPGLNLSTSGSTAGQITGTPTTAGTYNFTVQVTDSATPTANTNSTSLTITVSAAPTCVALGSESLLNGQYAFVLKGFDNGTGVGETAPEPVLVGGVLSFSGTGTISAGTIDLNGNSTAGVVSSTLTSGTYAVGSDHRGCMVITTSAGTQNYRFSLGNITAGVAATGHVIDFDSTGPFTAGIMRKQTASAFSTSQVTGNYAFGVSSVQNTANCNNSICGGRFGAVGVLNLATGAVSGGEVDFNNNGQLDASSTTNWPASAVSINSGGAYTVSGANGRGTLVFTPSGSGSSAVHVIIYVVSSTDALVLSSDDQTANSLFAGEFLKQSSGSFSTTPLTGAYVGYQSGLGTTSGTSRTTLLLLNASGANITGTQQRNDGGTFNSKSLSGITYSVSSQGRMSIAGGSNPPLFYLVSPNQAFSVGGDSNVESGFFQSQTGGPFSSTSASGTYAFGTVDPGDANGGDNLGVAAFASPNINVIEDNNGNGSQTLDGTQSFTYSIDSTGLGLIPSGCSVSVTPTTCQTVLYVISPTQAVIMDSQSSNPKVQVGDK
jgi:hypothetical protein